MSLKFFEAMFSTRMLVANAITKSVTIARIPSVNTKAMPRVLEGESLPANVFRAGRRVIVACFFMAGDWVWPRGC